MAAKIEKELIDFEDASYQFVEHVPQYLTCMICLGILEKPVATNCCGKMMCKSHWFKEKDNLFRACPNCRRRRYAVTPNGVIDGIIRGLQVYCRHHDDGCDWKGDLSTERDHRRIDSGCQFEPVLCRNVCGERIRRNDMRKHLEEECRLRPFPRNNSRSRFGAKEETYSRAKDCSNHPITCPKECTSRLVIPQNPHPQLKRSPANTVPCPFATSGCPVVLKKTDIDEHMKVALGKHLLLLFEQNNELRKETELLKADDGNLKKEIEALQKDYHDLKMRNESLTAANAELVANCEDAKERLDKLQNEEVRILRLALSHRPTWKEQLQYFSQGKDDVLPSTFIYSSAKSDKLSNRSWKSPSFYTSSKGYRLCFTVVPNGHFFAIGGYMSVLFSILPGKFDDDLPWPFEGVLRLSILNQNENGNHHSMDIDFSLFPEYQFSRTYSEEEGMGWGVLRFIKKDKLFSTTTENHCYFQSNSVHFRLSLVEETTGEA